MRVAVVLIGVGLLALPAASAVLPGADADLGMVCLDTNAGKVPATSLSYNQVPSDIPAASSAGVGTIAAYYGLSERFSKLVFEVGVPGTDNPASPGIANLDWFYWMSTSEGSAWVSIDSRLVSPAPDFLASSLTSGFATLEFKNLPGWTKTQAVDDPNCAGEFFYVMSTTGGAYATVPLLSTVSAAFGA